MRKLLIVFLSAVVLLAFTACFNQAQSTELEAAKAKIEMVTQENVLYQEKIAALEEALALALEQDKQAYTPEQQALLDDLPNQTALIPIEAALGGTFRYYSDQAKILNQKYVYAYAEDGHVAVDMILNYVQSGDGIIWSLAAYDIGDGWTLDG